MLSLLFTSVYWNTRFLFLPTYRNMIVTPVYMSRNMNSPSVWINLLKCNWATFIYICWNWIFLLLLSYLLIHDFATCLYLLKHEFSFCFYQSAEIQLYHLFLSKEMWTFPLFLSIYWKMIGPPVYNYWEINVLSVLTCLLKDKLPAWFFFSRKTWGKCSSERSITRTCLPSLCDVPESWG